MNPKDIRRKFGGDYLADERTFVMGIDQRFTTHFAERLIGRRVLETCTGGGFTTLSLAAKAEHVVTVEIDARRREQAMGNLARAGLSHRVTFILGDIMATDVLTTVGPVDAAFIDPDWAVTGPDHVYRFIDANTRPPADLLLRKVLDIIPDVALVLPPFISPRELGSLPAHERQRLYLHDRHELFCLYFGALKRTHGETEFRCA